MTSDRRLALRFYLSLATISMLGPLALDVYLPALPTLSRELSLGESGGQLSLTACLIGLAAGQLIAGPVSDVYGRRLPLASALIAFVVTSLLAATSASGPLFLGDRLFQGIAGGAGLVLVTAVVRDRYRGAAAARFYSLLLVVTGLAPIAAPEIGALVLRFTSWRGIFVTLAIAGLLLLGSVAMLPETLPAERRRRASLSAPVEGIRTAIARPGFVRFAVAGGLSYGAFFVYLSTSPFVIEGVYGASAELYGVVFAISATAFLLGTNLNVQIVGRVGPERMLRYSLAILAVASVTLPLGAAVPQLGLIGILAPIAIMIGTLGIVGPNANAMALHHLGDAAGSGSAVLGLLRFGVGALVAPMAGLSGSMSAMPMAVWMALLGISGAAAFALLGRRREPVPA